MSFNAINPVGDNYLPNLRLVQAGDTFQGSASDSEDSNANGILEAGEDRNGNGLIDRRNEDQNGNGKLDTMLGIPREGIAFSHDPRLAFGPPRFAAAPSS